MAQPAKASAGGAGKAAPIGAAGGQGKKYKIVLLGESGVGKSSLVLRLVKDEWVSSQHSTVGASFFRHSVTVDGQLISFDIWDTAGQERYKSLASMYYRGAAAALVVYDITSVESFERAKYWISQLIANSPDTIVVLVGNKCDREAERAVNREEAKRHSAESGLLHFEASAKEGTRVAEVFREIAVRLAASRSAATAPQGSTVVGRDGNRVGLGGGGGGGAKKDSDCPC